MSGRFACLAAGSLAALLLVAGCEHDSSEAVLDVGGSELALPTVSSHSGCLLEGGAVAFADADPCGEDEFEFAPTAGTLSAVHRGAWYNCCPGDIAVSASLVHSGGEELIVFTEKELAPQCVCSCCYEVSSTVTGLASGLYHTQYCWFDYGGAGNRCQSDQVTVP